LSIIDIYVFTAMLITLSYIKGGIPAQIFWRGGLQWRGLHLFFFYQVLLT